MTDRERPFIFLAPVLGFVVAFALVPVAVLIAQGSADVGGGEGALAVLRNPLNQAAVTNSIVQGTLSAAGAFVVGYPAGVFLGRYEWRGRPLVQSLLFVPFLLPSLVVVLAVQGVFSSEGLLGGAAFLRPFGSGIPGIVVVNVVFNLPVVALLTAVGVESSSTTLEETVAMLGAPPSRVYREVWGPPSLIGGLAGAVLAFLFSALAFAAPILLCGARCYTLEGRVWALAVTLLQPGAASVLAGWMVAFLVLPTAIYLVIVYRLRQRAVGHRRRRLDLRRPLPLLLTAWTAFVSAAVLVVLAQVIFRSLRPASPGAAWGSGWSQLFSSRVTAALGISVEGALVNTVAFAAASAILALLLGLLAGHVAVRRPRAGLQVQLVLFLPLLISPIVLSFGLAQFWRPLLGGESSVWLLILLSQSTLALPFALQGLFVALARVPPAPREAARLLGASPWRAYLDADLPAAGGALAAAALFAFALSLGEFTATYFLATPSFTTLPVLLYGLNGVRQFPAANALAAVLLLVSLGLLLLVSLGGRRVEI